jgi:hypothetical protein
MATKRKPLRRRQIGSEAEYKAWHDVFESSFDYFGDLEEFDVFDPTRCIIPVVKMPAARATFRTVTENAWKLFGARFMAGWTPTETRETPWALHEFGAP